MGEPSFEDDRKLLKEALLRALRIEAGNPAPEPVIFEQVAEAFDHQNEPEPPEIPGRAELASIFRERPPLALIFFDTPGLQDYVFKVLSPIDIFGGSSQVAHFTKGRKGDVEAPALSIFRSLRSILPDVEAATIFAGGGSGLLLVAASQAADTIASLEANLSQETAGDLHTHAVSLLVWPDELTALPSDTSLGGLYFDFDPRLALQKSKAPSRYAAALAALLGKHQRERSRRQHWPPSLDSEQQFTRCPACGGRPVDPESPRQRGEEIEQLCRPCHRRWVYGYTSRNGLDEPRTFDQLLDGLEPPVKSLAVIYADGANAGDLFSRLNTPARHRALSRAIETALQAAKDAVEQKLKEIFPAETNDLRFQSAIQGGDDLVMIVPARGALELGSELVAAFEKSIDEAVVGSAFAQAPVSLRKALGNFGLGIGVAVGDAHFPIQFLLDYARELLKNAKKLTRPDPDRAPVRSALDFLVLRGGTPLAGSIAKLRRDHQETASLVFHRRPLNKPDLDDFLKSTKALRRVRPAQVQAIRRELPRGRQLSLNLWRYQHARSAEWESWREAVGVSSSEIDGKLWRREGDKYVTDFLDQVDAFDLVVHSDPELQR